MVYKHVTCFILYLENMQYKQFNPGVSLYMFRFPFLFARDPNIPQPWLSRIPYVDPSSWTWVSIWKRLVGHRFGKVRCQLQNPRLDFFSSHLSKSQLFQYGLEKQPSVLIPGKKKKKPLCLQLCSGTICGAHRESGK